MYVICKRMKIVALDAEFAVSEVLELSLWQLSLPATSPAAESFHALFKPRHERRWPGSQRVHHISPEMVADKPYFSRHRASIQALIDSADCLVGFALENDVEALKREGILRLDEKLQLDVKDLHWVCYGREQDVPLNSRGGLEATALELGVRFDESEAHGASYDTQKTLECFQRLYARFREQEGLQDATPEATIEAMQQRWTKESEDYNREFAKGYVQMYPSRDGYRMKVGRNEPKPVEGAVTIAVNARWRAQDEIDARFARRCKTGERHIYRLTAADLQWLRAYKNEYDSQEQFHRKMFALRTS